MSLELGGKSPLIVFEDADMDSAVDWVLLGILWGSGQVCSATSRVLVHSSKKSELIDKVLARIALIKIGDTLSEEMIAFEGGQMGPVISKTQYDKIWVSQYCVSSIYLSINNSISYIARPKDYH